MLVNGDAYLLLDTVTHEETQRVFTGEYQFTGVLTRADVISPHHELVQKVVNALLRANLFIATHSAADIATVLPSVCGAGPLYFCKKRGTHAVGVLG